MKQNKKPKNEYIRKPVDKTNPYKDDVLYTPNGQWQYPGQVTKIPGGDITMEGVPYPVMGIDNLGNQQVMMPNMNYHFPGQHVTEYPVDLRIRGNLKNLRGSVGANFGSNRVELNMATPTNKFDPSFGVKYARTFAQGGLLNKTLTCPNCGWSWKAVDGGKDIATCHKCGSTVKMAYGGDPSLPDLTGHYQEGGWLDAYPFGGRFTKTHTHMDNGGSNKVQPLNLKKYEALPETTGRMQNKYPSLDTLKKQQAARLKNIRKPTAEETKLYAKPDTNVIRPESAGYITKDSPEIIGKAIPHKIAAYNRAVAESSTPDILQVRKEQPVEDKIMDAVLNPFTAATNLYQHGYLPDYFTQGPKNINDIPAQIAFSYTNPGKVLGMAKAATKLAPDIAKVAKDPTSGRNYLNIADDILSMAHVASLTNKVPGFVKAINDFKKKELGFLPGGLSVNVGNIKKLYSNESKMEKGLDRPHPFQYGGWLDEYTDEYRRGGSLYTPPGLKKKVRKKGTSKNIVSSINKLFTRNYDLFGPSGKSIYNPNSKYQSGGGWLDNLD
jgi:ribosomal protein L37AE/L43A